MYSLQATGNTAYAVIYQGLDQFAGLQLLIGSILPKTGNLEEDLRLAIQPGELFYLIRHPFQLLPNNLDHFHIRASSPDHFHPSYELPGLTISQFIYEDNWIDLHSYEGHISFLPDEEAEKYAEVANTYGITVACSRDTPNDESVKEERSVTGLRFVDMPAEF